VVIPVRDGARFLEELIPCLQAQHVDGGLDILAVDSGSGDGSVAALGRYGVRVVEIPPEDFDHGGARNLGAREACGETVVFLSQDALPKGEGFLARLTAPLREDSRVVGVFARQLPRPEADPVTRREQSAWVAAGAESRVTFLADHPGFDELAPMERYRLCAFDNVASAIRRQSLLRHPFVRTRFGEDLEWSHRMLRQGYGIAYAAEAAVVHSHPRRTRALFRRNYLGHRLLARLFGMRVNPSFPSLLLAGLAAVGGDLRTLATERAVGAGWLSAPLQALAAAYGQYRGARDETLGRPYPGWAEWGETEADGLDRHLGEKV
jgi:rhamnosyltransferase